MSFKEALGIETIKGIVSEIYESVEAIDEYGHVTIHSSENEKLKIRSEELQKKLIECKDELSKLQDEMNDWYSY